MFSHMRDWLSWIPSDAASASGCPKAAALGSPCSYMPCPASCSDDTSESRNASSR